MTSQVYSKSNAGKPVTNCKNQAINNINTTTMRAYKIIVNTVIVIANNIGITLLSPE